MPAQPPLLSHHMYDKYLFYKRKMWAIFYFKFLQNSYQNILLALRFARFPLLADELIPRFFFVPLTDQPDGVVLHYRVEDFWLNLL